MVTTSTTRDAARDARRKAEQEIRSSELRRGGIILGIVILAAALIGVALWGISTLFAPPERVGIQQPNFGAAHVAPFSFIEFAQYPPTSGNHYPTSAEPGNYPVTVPEGFWVHSLEHGYTVLLYNCDTNCEEIRAQIQPIMDALPESQVGYPKFIAMPYDRPLETPFVLVAWDYLQPMETLDRDLITRFYRSHVNRGPEAFGY